VAGAIAGDPCLSERSMQIGFAKRFMQYCADAGYTPVVVTDDAGTESGGDHDAHIEITD